MIFNWPAIRVFYRVWNPIAERQGIAADCDAGFDGGEFSGPLHAQLELSLFDATVSRVAKRIGMDAAVLYEQLEEAQYVSVDKLIALGKLP